MKARYFPSTDFLRAELGSKHSHAWRGIFSALPVVKAGCWWQVGNGTSICIWTDRWLPRPSTFQVISPPASLPLDSKISSLINPDSGDWNVTLITQTFLPDDVNSILGIPLSRHKPRDMGLHAKREFHSQQCLQGDAVHEPKLSYYRDLPQHKPEQLLANNLEPPYTKQNKALHLASLPKYPTYESKSMPSPRP